MLVEAGVEPIAPSSREIDLTDASSIERLGAVLDPADSVVMLAALTPDRGRDLRTFVSNVLMLQHLRAALEHVGCAHLVYLSSDAVYDPRVARISEATPAAAVDLYGAMHRAREIAAELPGLPLLLLRPTLVYGLDDTHNAYGPNRFRRSARQDGRITLFGAGEEMRDHVHVDDVADLVLRCLMRRTTGLLNVASGRSMSFKDVALLVARQYRGPVAIEESPRKVPVTHRHYDVTSLIGAFPDFRFRTLEDGIARCHAESAETGRG